MVKYSDTIAVILNNASVDAIDVGAGTATLSLYTSPIPVSVNDAATGTLLGVVNLPNPAFGGSSIIASPDGAVAALQGVPIAFTWADNGTLAYCRLRDRNGLALYDLTPSIGTSGDIQFNTLTAVSGEQGQITSGAWFTPLSG